MTCIEYMNDLRDIDEQKLKNIKQNVLYGKSTNDFNAVVTEEDKRILILNEVINRLMSKTVKTAYKPTRYLLTVQVSQGDKSYISNEVSDETPEIWLAREMRKYEKVNDDSKVVLLNSITIDEGNQLALNRIQSSSILIETK